jgi:hypothetical protein
MPLVNKKIVVALALLGFGWLAVEWLDWSRLPGFAATGRWEEHLLSHVIKPVLSLIVALLVWIAGSDSLSTRDRRLMRLAFSAVVLADLFFLCNNNMAGIGMFLVVQLLLIFRNGKGIIPLLAKGFTGENMWLLGIAAAVGGVNYLLIRFLFIPHSDNPVFPMIVGYSVFLCCSVWIGIAGNFTGYFPVANARMVAGGMILLYICDLTVGLNIILPHDRSYILSSSLTWFFYLPAITLLALSGYRWKAPPGVHFK